MICIDSDEDVEGAFRDGTPAKKKAAVPPIDLLESEEDSEDSHSPQLGRRKRKKPDATTTMNLPRAKRRTPAAHQKAASLSPIDLLASEDENDENRSPQLRRRRRTPPDDVEATDRALAERMQREEKAAAAARAVVGAARGVRREKRQADGSGRAASAVAPRRAEKRLRKEQDDEFEMGLLADQIKDIDRLREREEQEERQLARQLEDAEEASAKDRARDLMQGLGDEPRSDADGATRLRFALSTGERVDRRFRSATDRVEHLRAFLLLCFADREMNVQRIGLSTHFPKKTFLEADDHLTLEEAGLRSGGQWLIHVFDLDA